MSKNTENIAASKPIQSAKCKMSLLEAGDLDKIANWNLPTGKFSNRISSITEDSQAFLKGVWETSGSCFFALSSHS